MEMFNGQRGVWRTINGRHVFIRSGLTPENALKWENVKARSRARWKYKTDLDVMRRRYDEATNDKEREMAEKAMDNIAKELNAMGIDTSKWKIKSKNEYEKYYRALENKYALNYISKKIEDADKENGLRTVAKNIGANDEYEVVKALEGMVRNNRAKEVDDSTYWIDYIIDDEKMELYALQNKRKNLASDVRRYRGQKKVIKNSTLRSREEKEREINALNKKIKDNNKKIKDIYNIIGNYGRIK